MPDRPRDMYQNGRPLVPDFDGDEVCYHRVDPEFAKLAQADGKIDPLHFGSYQCVNLSSNRSRFSQPWYVLYPRAIHGENAVFKFRWADSPRELPRSKTAQNVEPELFEAKTDHSPDEDNYGHCETRVYRRGALMRPNQVKPEAKQLLRLRFAQILTLERPAGEPFPPPGWVDPGGM